MKQKELALAVVILTSILTSEADPRRGQNRRQGGGGNRRKHYTSSSYLDSYQFSEFEGSGYGHDVDDTFIDSESYYGGQTPNRGYDSRGQYLDPYNPSSFGGHGSYFDNGFDYEPEGSGQQPFHVPEGSGDCDDEDCFYPPSATSKTISTTTSATTTEFPNDDEDIIEGSGSGEAETDPFESPSSTSQPDLETPTRSTASTTTTSTYTTIAAKPTTTSTTTTTTTITTSYAFGPKSEAEDTMLVKNRFLVIILYGGLVFCLVLCILISLCMLIRCKRPLDGSNGGEDNSDTASSDLPIIKADHKARFRTSESPPPLPDLNLFEPLNSSKRDNFRNRGGSIRKSKRDLKDNRKSIDRA